MKKVLSCLLVVILSAIGLAGCGAGGNAGGEDVQRLSQVEVYSADGNLLGTVTDEVKCYTKVVTGVANEI